MSDGMAAAAEGVAAAVIDASMSAACSWTVRQSVKNILELILDQHELRRVRFAGQRLTDEPVRPTAVGDRLVHLDRRGAGGKRAGSRTSRGDAPRG